VSDFLTALQQSDNMFPNGSFAFSNGVEGMAALGQNFDAENLTGIFEAVLLHRWVECDRLALIHAWRAASEMELALADRALEAAILPETLRNGSKRNGAALVEAHLRIGLGNASRLKSALQAGTLLGHLPVMQGALWRVLGMDEAQAVLTSGYLTVTGLGSAAIRLGEAGAITVQKALHKILPLIAELAQRPARQLDAVAGALPWLDLACARQETAPLRLFAN
jgi:urease accessory protein